MTVHTLTHTTHTLTHITPTLHILIHTHTQTYTHTNSQGKILSDVTDQTNNLMSCGLCVWVCRCVCGLRVTFRAVDHTHTHTHRRCGISPKCQLEVFDPVYCLRREREEMEGERKRLWREERDRKSVG